MSALQYIRERMRTTPEGRDILLRRPLINSSIINISDLRSLPASTFGAAYISYMDNHGFSMDERTPVIYIEDEELAYIMTRYRQIHDFWHVLCNIPPSVVGEIALKWFEWDQVCSKTNCHEY